MHYTIINNFKTVYFNILSNFYLCFNLILPYYDDLIITLQKKALIHLYKGTTCSEVKKKRFLQFMNDVYELMNEYTAIVNEEKNIEFFKKSPLEYSDDSDFSDNTVSDESQDVREDIQTDKED